MQKYVVVTSQVQSLLECLEPAGYSMLVSLLGSLVHSANPTMIIQQAISASKRVPVGFEVERVLEEGSLGLACFINTV